MDYKDLLTKKHMPFVVGGLIVIIIAYLYYKHRSSAAGANTGSTTVSLPTGTNGTPLMESPYSFANMVPSNAAQFTANIPGTDSGLNSALNNVTQSLGVSTQPVFPSATPPSPPPFVQTSAYANGADGNGISTVYNPVGPFMGYEAQIAQVQQSSPSPVLWVGNTPIINAPAGINQGNVGQVFASGTGNAQEVVFMQDPYNAQRQVPTYISPGMPGFVPVSR